MITIGRLDLNLPAWLGFLALLALSLVMMNLLSRRQHRWADTTVDSDDSSVVQKVLPTSTVVKHYAAWSAAVLLCITTTIMLLLPFASLMHYAWYGSATVLSSQAYTVPGQSIGHAYGSLVFDVVDEAGQLDEVSCGRYRIEPERSETEMTIVLEQILVERENWYFATDTESTSCVITLGPDSDVALLEP